MTSRDTLRKEVLAQIISVIAEAEANGLPGYSTVKAAFPDVPDSVIAEAWVEYDDAQEEAWWQSLEKTIDAEVIRNALAAKPEGKRS